MTICLSFCLKESTCSKDKRKYKSMTFVNKNVMHYSKFNFSMVTIVTGDMVSETPRGG